MWTVIYIAQDKDKALQIAQALDLANIIAKTKNVGGDCYEILVPNTEIEEAHEILLDLK